MVECCATATSSSSHLLHVALELVSHKGDTVRVAEVATETGVATPADDNITSREGVGGAGGGAIDSTSKGSLEIFSRSTVRDARGGDSLILEFPDRATRDLGSTGPDVKSLEGNLVTSSRDSRASGPGDDLDLREPNTEITGDGSSNVSTQDNLLDLGHGSRGSGDGLDFVKVSRNDIDALDFVDMRSIASSEALKGNRGTAGNGSSGSTRRTDSLLVDSVDPHVLTDSGFKA
mmetsp:Transcript_14282/g.26219  ORF Transcript_14282/g.26219 Transcript_14282/m.26219 type:complete len:233 (+) Transcript_14282:6355-7053(+)